MAAAQKGLLAALRGALSDTRPTMDAFSVVVKDASANTTLELKQGMLRCTVSGGNGPLKSFSWSLGDPRYDTVGKLIRELSNQYGIGVSPAVNFAAQHPALDLSMDLGLADITTAPVTLRHRRFSDGELQEFLELAINAHNPNYSMGSVPAAETIYVLLKAQAAAYRVRAADVIERRGLAADAAAYLNLAADLEAQYRSDHERNARILPSAKALTGDIGSGDVISGRLFRSSPRHGYKSPRREALPIEPPNLLDAADNDVEDTVVRLRWNQQRDVNYSHVELWRDTQPAVERGLSGRNTLGATPSSALPEQSIYSKVTTARQVLGLRAGWNTSAPTLDGFFFWTRSEVLGAHVINASFTDGVLESGISMTPGQPIEPDTDYYYRLYAVDANGEVAPSRAVHVKTKTMRGRLARMGNGATLAPGAISVTSGPLAGGTSIVLTGTSFVAGTRVQIGGKEATVSLVTATSITCTSPPFTNPQFIGKPQDLLVLSPNGLADLVRSAFSYT